MFVLEICFLCHLLAFFAERTSADYSRCYYFNDNSFTCFSTNGTSQAKSWQDARAYCTANNSTLVLVDNAQVQNVLVQFRNESGMGNSPNWIGVHASSSPSTLPDLNWIDGRSQRVTNTFRYDANVYVQNGRMFVAIDYKNNRYDYHGQMWSVPGSYICQTTENCTSDDMMRSNSCYKKFEAKVTWFEASNRCLNLSNGKLATFNASQPTEDDQLVTWLNGSTSAYWIGLTNTWWIDVRGNVVLYTNWQKNHPPTSFALDPSTGTNCVVLTNNTNQNQWIDFDCDSEKPFICQTFGTKESTATATTVVTTAGTVNYTTARATQASTPTSSAVKTTSPELFAGIFLLFHAVQRLLYFITQHNLRSN